MMMATMKDEDFEFDEYRHPLKNDLVLDQIFSYITDTKTLKVCRSVSRVWNERATKQFQKNHCPINLGNSRRVTEFTKTICESRYLTYSSFIIPKTYNPRFAKQFKRFAHNVKHLQLVSKRNAYTPKNRDPDRINFASTINIIRETRNLESLEFSGIRFHLGYVQPDEFDEFEIPTLKEINIKLDEAFVYEEAEIRDFEEDIRAADVVLERLFRVASQLHTLRFELFAGALLKKLLAAIQSIQTLKVLKINNSFKESRLRFLTPAVWNLLSLKLTIHIQDFRLLERLLQQQVNTLEHLDLNLYTFRQTPFPSMTFPVFPRLKKFKFISKMEGYQTFPFRRYSSNGETDFPALKSVWANDDIIKGFFTRKDMVTPEVEELIYEVTDRKNWIYGGVQSLNIYFPKLKKLTIKNATSVEIRSLFETGNYLDELCIDTFRRRESGDRDIDELLTGIPVPDWLVKFFSLSKLSKKGKLMEEAVISFLRKDDDSSHLIGLSNLKRFEIFNDTRYQTVTDAAGYVGLLCMKPLDHLLLYNSNLSTSCVAELKTRHQRVTKEWLTSEERDAIREKEFELL